MEKQKKNKSSFPIENLLVVIAILMILTATFMPQFAKSHNEANVSKAAHAVSTVSPPTSR